MTYSVVTREFNNSKWISGSTDFLLGTENIKRIEGAKYLWNDHYARFCIRRYFDLEKVEKSRIHLICDNIFDLYINGTLVSFEQKEFEGDITEHLVVGRNRINIRAYQVSENDFFTSAITGEVVLGSERIVTDESWQSYLAGGFFVNTEREDWQTVEMPYSGTKVCDIHPRLNKRSLYMRKSFNLTKKVKSASLFVSDLGQSEAYINGKRTDSDILPQGINNNYQEYREYDVTSLLTEGKNAIAAITGNGWLNSHSHSMVLMNRPKLICELVITYEDGSTDIIGTDESWKVAFSPLTDNDLQYGERYDARLEIKDFASADLCDDTWANAEECNDVNVKPFALRNYPPIVIKRMLAPSKTENKYGGIFLTFPENCSGRFRLEMKNVNNGQKVTIKVFERMHPEKDEPMIGVYTSVFFNRDNWKGGKSEGAMSNLDVYTCRGDDKEVFEPHFTFTGYRYMLIEGLDNSQLDAIYMTVMHNDLTDTGSLSSSYNFINELFDATVRTWKANIFNGPMDCPTREKNFWSGDMQLFCSTACYLSSCLHFLARWSDGGRMMCPQVYGWGDQIYIIPMTLYRFYGDKGVLKLRYPDILAYAKDKMQGLKDHLPENPSSPFSDHLSPELMNVDPKFFACTYYCYMLKNIAEIADILGDAENREFFENEFALAKDTYNKRFFKEKDMNYNPPNQSGIVLPLACGLVPDELKDKLAAKLNELVRAKGKLDTGFGGTRYLMPILSEYGYTDTAFMLLDREEFPSWKNMLSHGTGTICESWKGAIDLMDEESISMNHFTLGAVVGWMFECLGGISYQKSEPGFTKVVLEPHPVKEIGSFKCSLDTVNGLISVGWNYDNGYPVYEVNTEMPSTVILPSGEKLDLEAGTHLINL